MPDPKIPTCGKGVCGWESKKVQESTKLCRQLLLLGQFQSCVGICVENEYNLGWWQGVLVVMNET
jgi:hypothetical protein